MPIPNKRSKKLRRESTKLNQPAKDVRPGSRENVHLTRLIKDDVEQRQERIDQLLEELRLNTEDLHELARQAVRRAIESRRSAKSTIAQSQALRARGKGRRKR